MAPEWRVLPFESGLLFGGSFGSRVRFEPVVGYRLAAFDRQAVRPQRQTFLGPLDGGELSGELLPKTGRKFVVVEFGSLVAQMLVARGQVAVGRMGLAGQRFLDPLALAEIGVRHPVQGSAARLMQGVTRPGDR